jgi:hypothetical protein
LDAFSEGVFAIAIPLQVLYTMSAISICLRGNIAWVLRVSQSQIRIA